MGEYKVDKMVTDKGKEVAVLYLPGEINSDEVESLEKELLRLLENNKFIVLEFSSTRFLCSRAVGVIAYLFSKLKRAGGNLYVVGVKSFVKKLFEVIQLDKIIPQYDSLENFSRNN